MALHHSFTGKRVLVTGGGRGLGFDITKRFYNDGAVVFVIDREPSLLESLKLQMPNVTTLCIDLSNWEDAAEAVRSISPLDHLVNNAGILRSSHLLDAKPEDFDMMVGVNLRATLCVSQAFVKGIIAAGTGRCGTIVNMSSMSDRVAFWGGGVYGVTKAAVTRLTMAMGLEFAEHNVRVNCVNPSFIPTEMVRTIPAEFLVKAKPIAARTPLPAPLEPKDVTDAVVFFSSPLSAQVTGTSLCVDGGLRTA